MAASFTLRRMSRQPSLHRLETSATATRILVWVICRLHRRRLFGMVCSRGNPFLTEGTRAAAGQAISRRFHFVCVTSPGLLRGPCLWPARWTPSSISGHVDHRASSLRSASTRRLARNVSKHKFIATPTAPTISAGDHPAAHGWSACSVMASPTHQCQ